MASLNATGLAPTAPWGLTLGRHWMVKYGSAEFSRETLVEERDYVLTNPHEAQLSEIFAIAHIEYGLHARRILGPAAPLAARLASPLFHLAGRLARRAWARRA